MSYSAPPHTFDGKSVARNVGNFQLCDISDPELRELLDNPCWWTSDCNVRLFAHFTHAALRLAVGESRILLTQLLCRLPRITPTQIHCYS